MPDRPLHSLRTLVFIRSGDQVLLLRRRADKAILPGYYNGVGGHVEAGEDLVSAAIREAREETGLRVDGLRLKGLLHVSGEAGDPGAARDPADIEQRSPRPGVLVVVFTAEVTRNAGDPTRWTGDEGELEWVARVDARSLPLVPDVPRYWAALWDEAPAPFVVHLSTSTGDVLHYWSLP